MRTNKLYVGNLSYRTTEDGLRQKFAESGNVLSTTIMEGRGFGFVEMESKEAAQKAKDELDGSELDGQSIRVDEARPQRQRGGGRPRGGGGPRGGGRRDFRDRRQRW
jgi:RNA recognition motif-containing protein